MGFFLAILTQLSDLSLPFTDYWLMFTDDWKIAASISDATSLRQSLLCFGTCQGRKHIIIDRCFPLIRCLGILSIVAVSHLCLFDRWSWSRYF